VLYLILGHVRYDVVLHDYVCFFNFFVFCFFVLVSVFVVNKRIYLPRYCELTDHMEMATKKLNDVLTDTTCRCVVVSFSRGALLALYYDEFIRYRLPHMI